MSLISMNAVLILLVHPAQKTWLLAIVSIIPWPTLWYPVSLELPWHSSSYFPSFLLLPSTLVFPPSPCIIFLASSADFFAASEPTSFNSIPGTAARWQFPEECPSSWACFFPHSLLSQCWRGARNPSEAPIVLGMNLKPLTFSRLPVHHFWTASPLSEHDLLAMHFPRSLMTGLAGSHLLLCPALLPTTHPNAPCQSHQGPSSSWSLPHEGVTLQAVEGCCQATKNIVQSITSHSYAGWPRRPPEPLDLLPHPLLNVSDLNTCPSGFSIHNGVLQKAFSPEEWTRIKRFLEL